VPSLTPPAGTNEDDVGGCCAIVAVGVTDWGWGGHRRLLCVAPDHYEQQHTSTCQKVGRNAFIFFIFRDIKTVPIKNVRYGHARPVLKGFLMILIIF
jgi:hypothetical protein